MQTWRNLGRIDQAAPARARAPWLSTGAAPASYLSPSSPGSQSRVTRGQTWILARLRIARSPSRCTVEMVCFLVVSVSLLNKGCGLCGCALISGAGGTGHNLRPGRLPGFLSRHPHTSSSPGHLITSHSAFPHLLSLHCLLAPSRTADPYSVLSSPHISFFPKRQLREGASGFRTEHTPAEKPRGRKVNAPISARERPQPND